VTIEVLITPAAENELGEAERWYDRLGRAEELHTAFLHAVGQLEDFPESAPMQPSQHRRLVLGRFPYAVYFRIRSEHVLIVAIAHTSRRPGYWLRR
jgi:plasmid stabilization system protein ParE